MKGQDIGTIDADLISLTHTTYTLGSSLSLVCILSIDMYGNIQVKSSLVLRPLPRSWAQTVPESQGQSI